jgi:hypothetical protein
MNLIHKYTKPCMTVLFVMLITACTPEVGSDDWCTMMGDISKGDWTANEVADYAKHCILN